MLDKLFQYLKFFSYSKLYATLKLMLRFIVDLIITLSVAILFMRFAIICGTSQITALFCGLVGAIVTNFYLKFRYKFIEEIES